MDRKMVEDYIVKFFVSNKKKKWQVQIANFQDLGYRRILLKSGDFGTTLYADVEDKFIYLVLDCADGTYCSKMLKIGFRLAEKLTRMGIRVMLRGDFWLGANSGKTDKFLNRLKEIEEERQEKVKCERIIVELV